jgi:hypothetical protein
MFFSALKDPAWGEMDHPVIRAAAAGVTARDPAALLRS